MSEKKPKIYGFCNAGCKWETVHKDDFAAAATWVKQYPDENGVYNLSPVKCYKIVSPVVSNAYTAAVKLRYATADIEDGDAWNSYDFSISEFDEYRNYFYFEILSLTATDSAMEIVYEVNGNRYLVIEDGADINATTAYLEITGATEVLLFNADASIVGIEGEKGATGASIVSTKLIGQDENGGNIYMQTFDNGVTATFTAPRGEAGASVVSARLIKITSNSEEN